MLTCCCHSAVPEPNLTRFVTCNRYFLQQWPKLCYLAYDGNTPFGTVVCKMDMHRDHMRGYVAMLVVDKAYRGKGAGELTPQPAALNGAVGARTPQQSAGQQRACAELWSSVPAPPSQGLSW